MTLRNAIKHNKTSDEIELQIRFLNEKEKSPISFPQLTTIQLLSYYLNLGSEACIRLPGTLM